MKQAVSLYDFRDAFRRMDRMDQFTHEGLEVLFDYLEEYEESTGEEIELDVIALCCDFTEESVDEIAQNYGITIENADMLDEDDQDMALRDEVREYLEYHSQIVGETSQGTIIYQSF